MYEHTYMWCDYFRTSYRDAVQAILHLIVTFWNVCKPIFLCLSKIITHPPNGEDLKFDEQHFHNRHQVLNSLVGCRIIFKICMTKWSVIDSEFESKYMTFLTITKLVNKTRILKNSQIGDQWSDLEIELSRNFTYRYYVQYVSNCGILNMFWLRNRLFRTSKISWIC